MSKSYWKLIDEEYEFIKGEVCHIFEKYRIKCIPVSGFEIASKMGITLIAYSGLSEKKLKKALEVSEDGFFIEKDGREFIFYNDMIWGQKVILTPDCFSAACTDEHFVISYA